MPREISDESSGRCRPQDSESLRTHADPEVVDDDDCLSMADMLIEAAEGYAKRLSDAGLVVSGQVCEARALDVCTRQWQRPHTVSGFFAFDQIIALYESALQLEAQSPSGSIYLTLNPVDSRLLARKKNRLDDNQIDQTTDKDIIRRRFVLIDCDPIRPGGISSTDGEKRVAYDLCRRIRDFLIAGGWPSMPMADSGNGYHLLPLIDLPNDDQSRELVRSVLDALSQRFSSETVNIDTKVFNASRITKLYGTLARKGDHTSDRPHRRSDLIEIPEDLQVTPRALLEDLRRSAASQSTPTPTVIPVSVATNAERTTLVDRARSHVARVRPAIEGESGSNVTFHVANALLDHGLTDDEAWPILREYSARCVPPWSDKELRHKLADARKQPRNFERFSSTEVLDACDDPYRLARVFLDDHTSDDGQLLLRCWADNFYRWRDNVYRPFKESELIAQLTAAVKREFDRIARAANTEQRNCAKKISTSLIKNVLLALRSLTAIDGDIQPPAWLDERQADPQSLIVAENAIVDLAGFVAQSPTAVIAPTPSLFSMSCVPFHFDKCASQPVEWLSFLNSIWPDDVDSRDTLEQILGLLLTPDTSHQKLFMLVGPPRSGKGTIGWVIEQLLGTANVVSPTLSSLSTSFGLAPLVGKLAAIISDARIGSRSDLAVITERLLSISGEDALTIDRKYREPVTTRLSTRIVLLTNEIPRVVDQSGALGSRFIVLRLNRSFLGREDHELRQKLLIEMPGILLRAINGWQRLRTHGRFVQPQSATDDVITLRDLASSVKAFISDCCNVGDAYRIGRRELFDAWCHWCVANGQRNPGTQAIFGRDLRSAVPIIRDSQTRDGTGGRPRQYVGIRLATGQSVVPE